MIPFSSGCWLCVYGSQVGRIGFLGYCSEHEQEVREHWEELREKEPELVEFFEKMESVNSDETNC